MRTVTRGLIAGAAGTAALNPATHLATYLAITVRGRAPSSAQQLSVRRLADTGVLRSTLDGYLNRPSGQTALAVTP